ncbi:MAG TPA: YceI family protein [Gammaproteobacteria bacterium]|nr:YceI family protein [Gammaproteobacteria bacterium]
MKPISPLVVLPALLLVSLAFAQSGAERVYAVDPAASELHWLTYKAGSLQRLGHNHVISVGRPDGTVTVNTADLAKSRFDLTIPVDGLVVDNPELRQGLGPDFASVPSADDVAGTRKNMLGDKLLQAEKFPSIHVRGTGPFGAAGSQTFKITVELVGKSVDLTVPTEVTVDDAGVTAHGAFELTHSELGLQPFSVMLGAIQVADKMHFSYEIKTKKAAAAP